GGNVAAAARLLGIGRATMYRRMERAGLTGIH
ncbi:MAG: sigma-54-dependent Fis family transcriptional regulator, partial [Proteobacteria bacterium]|nr:sigma-54-dependent Fis family transcriptional regulator [Pseudomonadota bacterium]